MSTRRTRKLYSTTQKLGSNGRPACLECNLDIVNPRRSTFCGKACSDRFMLKSNPGFARLKVFERDRGICADCRKDVFDGAFYRNGSPRSRMSRGSGDLWQADHIVPVVEGGGECGLDNLRTLCTRCHKAQTRALSGRMAKKRQSEKALPLLEMSHA